MIRPGDPSQELRDALDLIAETADGLERGATVMRSWQIEKLARRIKATANRAESLAGQLATATAAE